MDKHRSIHHVILQRACFGGKDLRFSTGYTGGVNWKHRCIDCGNDQRHCFGISRKPFSTGYTGASKEHAPVHLCQTVTVSDCQRLLFGFSVTGYTGATPSVYPVPTTFWAVSFQRLGVLLHSI